MVFPNFHNRTYCEKYLKDNKHNSPNLARKYAHIFVLVHYLFLKAHSFPCAMLSENCSLLGTGNFRRQVSVHISTPNGGCCLYNYALNSRELNNNYVFKRLPKKRPVHSCHIIDMGMTGGFKEF